MHFVFLIISLLMLSSCHGPQVIPQDPHGPPKNLLLVTEFEAEEISRTIVTYSVLFKYHHHLNLMDSFLYVLGDRQVMRMEYQTQNIMRLCEARCMLVDMVEGFLAQLNNNPHLSQMYGFPFTPRDLEIYVDFSSFYSRYDDPLMLGFMSLRDGIVSYSAWDHRDPCDECMNYRTEYYWQSKLWCEAEKAGELRYRPLDIDIPQIADREILHSH